jgi:Ca2+-binding EF-hand superfamily protein
MNRQTRTLLATLAAGFLASCATAPETDHDLFVQADTNKDSRISLAEANTFGLPRLFNRFDVDGDGSVTLAEARTVEPGFDQKLFSERDLNHDGKVSYAEYEKVALAKGGLKKQFAAVDLNHDNIIDQSEAEAFIASKEETAPKALPKATH